MPNMIILIWLDQNICSDQTSNIYLYLFLWPYKIQHHISDDLFQNEWQIKSNLPWIYFL